MSTTPEISKSTPQDVPPVVMEMAKVDEIRRIEIRKRINPKNIQNFALRQLRVLEGLSTEQIVREGKEAKQYSSLIEATLAWQKEADEKGEDSSKYVARRTAGFKNPETLVA